MYCTIHSMCLICICLLYFQVYTYKKRIHATFPFLDERSLFLPLLNKVVIVTGASYVRWNIITTIDAQGRGWGSHAANRRRLVTGLTRLDLGLRFILDFRIWFNVWCFCTPWPRGGRRRREGGRQVGGCLKFTTRCEPCHSSHTKEASRPREQGPLTLQVRPG
jgi:hypothetical protein